MLLGHSGFVGSFWRDSPERPFAAGTRERLAAPGDEPFHHLLSFPRFLGSEQAIEESCGRSNTEGPRAGKRDLKGEDRWAKSSRCWGAAPLRLFKVVPKGPGGLVCLSFFISSVTPWIFFPATTPQSFACNLLLILRRDGQEEEHPFCTNKVIST